MANKYPLVYLSRGEGAGPGGIPIEELNVGDVLIDPNTGMPYYTPGDARISFAAAPPSDPAKTYAPGDVAFNTDPATNKSVVGWICVVGGIGGVAVFAPFYAVYGTPAHGQAIVWDSAQGKALWSQMDDPTPADEDGDDDTNRLLGEAAAFAESVAFSTSISTLRSRSCRRR